MRKAEAAIKRAENSFEDAENAAARAEKAAKAAEQKAIEAERQARKLEKYPRTPSGAVGGGCFTVVNTQFTNPTPPVCPCLQAATFQK